MILERCARAAALSLLVVACHKGEKVSRDTPSAPSASASATPAAAADPALDAFFASRTAPLTAAIEQTLLVAVKDCSLNDDPASLKHVYGVEVGPSARALVDEKCDALKKWRRATDEHSRVDKGASRAVLATLLVDPSPAVRCVASQGLSAISLAQWDEAATKPFLAVADKEQVPSVLACMISGWFFSSLHQPPEAKAFLVKWADHPRELVRRSALGSLLTTFGAKFPETFDTVATKLEQDPSVDLRAALCEHLYDTDNLRAVPLFAKYLAEGTPDALDDGCFGGAVDAWANKRKKRPSREAFELTMKVLEATPRTKTRPTAKGLGMASLAGAKAAPGDEDDRVGQGGEPLVPEGASAQGPGGARDGRERQRRRALLGRVRLDEARRAQVDLRPVVQGMREVGRRVRGHRKIGHRRRSRANVHRVARKCF